MLYNVNELPEGTELVCVRERRNLTLNKIYKIYEFLGSKIIYDDMGSMKKLSLYVVNLSVLYLKQAHESYRKAGYSVSFDKRHFGVSLDSIYAVIIDECGEHCIENDYSDIVPLVFYEHVNTKYDNQDSQEFKTGDTVEILFTTGPVGKKDYGIVASTVNDLEITLKRHIPEDLILVCDENGIIYYIPSKFLRKV